MTYKTPSSFAGKTLRQLGNEGVLQGRSDIIADLLGVPQNYVFKGDEKFNVQFQQGHMGSLEQQTITGNFKEWTAADQAKEFEDQYVAAVQSEIDREAKFVEQYLGENPFAFDEELAKQSATAEYEPYYSELLEDYISDVNVKRETVQDEKQLAQTLYKLDTSQRSRAYDRAVSQAEQGFAGQGMFFSGIKQRTTGQQEVEYKSDTQRATEGYGVQQAGFERTLGEYDTATQRQTRDIGRAQETAVQGGILQRRQEALEPYYATLEQAYKRQFPTANQSISDYLPSSFV